MAVAQRELVERKKWLTPEEFVEDWAVAQLLPGPNVINLSLMIGDRHFGLGCALAAMAGLLCFPLAIVLTLAAYFSDPAALPATRGALRGMGAVVAGLIAANAIKLVPAIRRNPIGTIGCGLFSGAAFVGIGYLHLPLIGVVLGLGLPACGYAAWKLHSIAVQHLASLHRSKL